MISKLALAIRGFKVGTYTMEHVVSCMASGCREDDFECPVGQSFIVGESLSGTSMACYQLICMNAVGTTCKSAFACVGQPFMNLISNDCFQRLPVLRQLPVVSQKLTSSASKSAIHTGSIERRVKSIRQSKLCACIAMQLPS